MFSRVKTFTDIANCSSSPLSFPLHTPCHTPSGDTTALPVHPAVPEAVKKVLELGGCTGYGHSRGLPETRAALARLYSPFTLDPRGLTAEVGIHISFSLETYEGENLLVSLQNLWRGHLYCRTSNASKLILIFKGMVSCTLYHYYLASHCLIGRM